MRKSNRIIAFCLSILIIVSTVFAAHIFAAMIVDGYFFDLDDNKCAVINGWNNSSDTLSIPAYIGDFRVTAIDNSAFKNDDYIHNLDMSNASYLDSIGMYAFSGSALNGSLIIPTRVTNIGTSAFEGCNSLIDVSYSSFGGIVSAQCFQYCENLQNVILTDYISTIERYAFYQCSNLESITIPRSVTSISRTAFSGCDNLAIHCYTGSYAQTYAEENGIDYVLIDAPTEPTTPTEPATQEPTSVTEPSTEPATQEPTAVTEPSTDPTEPKAPYMLGDTDNSGDIDVIDATFVQRYSIGAFIPCEDTIMQADVDSSGDVSSIDATFILRHLIHISVGYPIGEYVS